MHPEIFANKNDLDTIWDLTQERIQNEVDDAKNAEGKEND